MPDSAGWDSCIFIEVLEKANRERYEACEAMCARAQKGDLIIVATTLAITETNKLPDSPALPEEQSRLILEFFENPYIVLRSVDRQTAEYAHELVRTYGLGNIDAIHVATAILARVPVLYTYDGVKGRGRKGLLQYNLKIGNPPLRIEVPPDPAAGTIFAKPAEPDDSEPEPPPAPAQKPRRRIKF